MADSCTLGETFFQTMKINFYENMTKIVKIRKNYGTTPGPLRDHSFSVLTPRLSMMTLAMYQDVISYAH